MLTQQMIERVQEMIRPRLKVRVLRKRALCLVLFGLVMVGCATSPTGRTQLMLVSEATAISASRQAYLAEMQRLEKEGKLSEDAAMARWVGDITGRLVAQAIRMRPDAGRWDWSVAIVEDPDTVNAWCMAGGRMAVYTGLLRKLDPTEDEFAQVMGHEIAHALANHTAEKMSVAMASQLGIIAVGVASDDPRLTAAAAVAATVAVGLPNSRAAESEADRIGIELAARAGYDPHAAVTLWQKMNEVGGGRPPQFLSTHPDPENRQARLAALVPEMMPYYQAPGERPFHPVTIVDHE
jgi:predicted Zn-dependent protease